VPHISHRCAARAGQGGPGEARRLRPFDPGRDHLLVIYESGAAYLYRLGGHPSQTRPLLTVVSR
jgi:hypothetical protein